MVYGAWDLSVVQYSTEHEVSETVSILRWVSRRHLHLHPHGPNRIGVSHCSTEEGYEYCTFWNAMFFGLRAMGEIQIPINSEFYWKAELINSAYIYPSHTTHFKGPRWSFKIIFLSLKAISDIFLPSTNTEIFKAKILVNVYYAQQFSRAFNINTK
jgi:hypothetical protein